MSAGCAGTPVSWPRLEQHALGELPAADARAVDQHLADCPTCRACFDEARETIALPPLPQTAAPRTPWWRTWPTWTGAAVAAAALLLVIVLRPDGSGHRAGALPGPRVAYKGGELAIDLVRERGGDASLDPTHYADGDRFAVLVTCPPGDRWIDVVVTQDGRRDFPIAAARVACGNRIDAGAFRLTGDTPASVCVIAGDERPPRNALPGDGAACALIRPAR